MIIAKFDTSTIGEAPVGAVRRLTDWTGALSLSDLDYVLEYRNMKGVPQRKLYGSLVLNLFSHHTHHRGQATTLLSQFGLDVGVTDLLALIPDEVPA